MAAISTRKILYIGQLLLVLVSFLAFARWTLTWPPLYHLLWLVLFALYQLVPPFRDAFNRLKFGLYCKLIYENEVFWELFYDFCATILPKNVMGTINYGYASLEKDGKTVELSTEDEHDRMSLQLFHRTVTGGGILTELEGKTVLEVSSGRAAGLNWIAQNFRNVECVGIDLSGQSIKLAKELYSGTSNMRFLLGNAETFVNESIIEEGSVDVIISVDSAHLYPNFGRFVEQCHRALRPGGYFFMSDFMEVGKFEICEKILQNSEFRLLDESVTTKNVLRALDLDSDRRLNEVIKHSPTVMRPFFVWNSGAKGSRIYKLLSSGEFTAHSWFFQK